jgi:SAM-dependent methyltransferase
MTSTQRYFDRRAQALDRRYGGRAAGVLRGGPVAGRELAVSVTRRLGSPAVLDLGCGTGRVAEAVLDAGAATYVGVDVSPRMLKLARERLSRFDDVELLESDVAGTSLDGSYDLVLALGLFEYLHDPTRAAAWMRERCSSTLVASFTRWDWLKGPPRRVHYGIRRLRIADYTEESAATFLVAGGFSRVEFPVRGRRGFLVTAVR